MDDIDNKLDSAKSEDPKGPIPYWADRDPEFMSFLYSRDERVREEMSSMHERVRVASMFAVRLGSYPGIEEDDFNVYICPVKVKERGVDKLPILLTYCKWGNITQMLYWPMDMIPLSNEERSQVWENFVKDDEIYYNRNYSNLLI